MRRRLVIIGASALGRKACNYARDSGEYDVVGFLDDRPDVLDGLEGYPPILCSPDDYEPRPDDNFVCAVGSCLQRERFVRAMEARGGRFVNVIHPTAHIGPHVRLGVGCIVCPEAFLDCDIEVGSHVILNVRSFVAHDCRLGDFAMLSPGCNVAGRCKIGVRAFLGIGVVCKPDMTIGADAMVGAGAVVIRDIPAKVTAVGNPARPLPR